MTRICILTPYEAPVFKSILSPSLRILQELVGSTTLSMKRFRNKYWPFQNKPAWIPEHLVVYAEYPEYLVFSDAKQPGTEVVVYATKDIQHTWYEPYEFKDIPEFGSVAEFWDLVQGDTWISEKLESEVIVACFTPKCEE